MLHLKAGVYFQERDRSVDTNQEFAGASADISSLLHDRFTRCVELFNLSIGQEWRRGFFYQLLVTTLQRAVTGTDYNRVTVRIDQDLSLHVTWFIQIALDKALAPTKAGDGFANRGIKELRNFFHRARDFQAASATAMSRFDSNRQAMFFRKCNDFGRRINWIDGASNKWCADFGGNLACRYFVPKSADCRWRRSDPNKSSR